MSNFETMEMGTESGRHLEIRKYQNRRYYDTTNSCHISLEQIHRSICDGYSIRVVDAKSGREITTKVLTQILLEYEPTKLDFFSSELLTQVIRVNDKILKDFFEVYFGKAFGVFMKSKTQFEEFMRRSHMLPAGEGGKVSEPFVSAFEAFNPFSKLFGPPPEAKTQESDLAEQIESLRQQIEDLSRKAGK